MLIVGH